MIKTDFLRYFDLSVLAKKDEIENKSRNKLIVMSIDDFLMMAEPLPSGDSAKSAKVATLFDEILLGKSKLVEIPIIFARTRHQDKEAQVEAHEGRHRALMLKAHGCKYMPVMLQTSGIRFSEQESAGYMDYWHTWPETLRSENGECQMAFPVTREQAGDKMLQFYLKKQQFEYGKEEALTI